MPSCMTTRTHVVLFLVLTTVGAQHVPLEVSMVPDWLDTGDPLAACSNQTVVAATIDALMVQPSSTATIIIKLDLDEVQQPDAVVFSAAGYTLAVWSAGEVDHQQAAAAANTWHDD